MASSLMTTVQHGETAFVEMVGSIFDVGRDVALVATAKLRSFMQQDHHLRQMFTSAQNGTLSAGEDEVFEQTRQRVLTMDLRAIVQAVVLPIAGGYLGYAFAAALGATGGLPVLIGFLIGAVIFLMVTPGAWQRIKTRIDEIVDGIFKPAF